MILTYATISMSKLAAELQEAELLITVWRSGTQRISDCKTIQKKANDATFLLCLLAVRS